MVTNRGESLKAEDLNCVLLHALLSTKCFEPGKQCCKYIADEGDSFKTHLNRIRPNIQHCYILGSNDPKSGRPGPPPSLKIEQALSIPMIMGGI